MHWLGWNNGVWPKCVHALEERNWRKSIDALVGSAPVFSLGVRIVGHGPGRQTGEL